MRWLRHIYEISVFRPLNLKYIHNPNSTLVALFHRTAATLYLIYAVWGVSSLFANLPPIPLIDVPTEFIFSALIIPCAALSCVGATFFPRTGRLELFAASALMSLIVIYLAIILVLSLQTGGNLNNVIINTTHIVVPTARVLYVYKALVWKAETTQGEQK